MFNIIVCDDNAEFVKKSYDIISKELLKQKIIGDISLYTDSRNLYDDLLDHKPVDIAVLDIEMPHYSGQDVSELLSQLYPGALIIFLTSHVRYAVESYELAIFRFVSKENIEEKLPTYIKDAISFLLLQSNQTFTVKKTSEMERIPYKEILYFYKDGKNTVVHCLNGREIKIRQPLSETYRQINENEFVIIDRGYIVNFTHISKISRDSAVLTNGEILSISRQHLKETKLRLCRYWGEHI